MTGYTNFSKGYSNDNVLDFFVECARRFEDDVKARNQCTFELQDASIVSFVNAFSPDDRSLFFMDIYDPEFRNKQDIFKVAKCDVKNMLVCAKEFYLKTLKAKGETPISDIMNNQKRSYPIKNKNWNDSDVLCCVNDFLRFAGKVRGEYADEVAFTYVEEEVFEQFRI